MTGDPTPLDRLRAQVARIERGGGGRCLGTLPFGVPAIDGVLPGGGLATAALHEVIGTGMDIELAAGPALFAAGILARRPGPVLWVLERRDLFAPGLAAAGLHPARVIYAEAGPKAALPVMEEGLRHPGLAGVVAEVSVPVSLTQSRRFAPGGAGGRGRWRCCCGGGRTGPGRSPRRPDGGSGRSLRGRPCRSTRTRRAWAACGGGWN